MNTAFAMQFQLAKCAVIWMKKEEKNPCTVHDCDVEQRVITSYVYAVQCIPFECVLRLADWC